MKLYVFQVAPNPTKVRLYVAEKNAAGDELPVDEISVNIPEGEARTPEFLKKNPHGQLPVLELDDGRCFAESLAIIEYLGIDFRNHHSWVILRIRDSRREKWSVISMSAS